MCMGCLKVKSFIIFEHAQGWGHKVKIFSFLKVVMLHVKLTGIRQRTQCKAKFCPIIHPRPTDRVKRSKHFFSEGLVALKEKK